MNELCSLYRNAPGCEKTLILKIHTEHSNYHADFTLEMVRIGAENRSEFCPGKKIKRMSKNREFKTCKKAYACQSTKFVQFL